MCQFSCHCLSWLPELASQKAQELPSRCEVWGASLPGTPPAVGRAAARAPLPPPSGFGIGGSGLVRVSVCVCAFNS